MNQQVFIIAVSGGVDSIVLLHRIAAAHNYSDRPIGLAQVPRFIVAHFDHGIRKNSKNDADFVRELAKKYQLHFELGGSKLGPKASEDSARNARYKFLFELKETYNAEAIVTAHHQDDIIETMFVNIVRGTSPRGLIGFTRKGIIRPLLSMTKVEIKLYAQKNSLSWREDSTNLEKSYLRNYLRQKIDPNIKHKKQLLSLRQNTIDHYLEIDNLIGILLSDFVQEEQSNFYKINRSKFVTLPYIVQCEFIATLLREINKIPISKKMVHKAVITCKTLQINKRVELAQNLVLVSKSGHIIVNVQVEHV